MISDLLSAINIHYWILQSLIHLLLLDNLVQRYHFKEVELDYLKYAPVVLETVHPDTNIHVSFCVYTCVYVKKCRKAGKNLILTWLMSVDITGVERAQWKGEIWGAFSQHCGWDTTPCPFLPSPFPTCFAILPTSFEAMTGHKAPSSDGLLAEVFWGFPQL